MLKRDISEDESSKVVLFLEQTSRLTPRRLVLRSLRWGHNESSLRIIYFHVNVCDNYSEYFKRQARNGTDSLIPIAVVFFSIWRVGSHKIFRNRCRWCSRRSCQCPRETTLIKIRTLVPAEYFVAAMCTMLSRANKLGVAE